MCLIIAAYKVVEEFPIIIASNRDEFLDRKSIPPRLYNGKPGIICGRDERCGGTWMGINAHGVFVGLTNRSGPRGEVSCHTKKSRGFICLEALQQPSAEKIKSLVESQDIDRYNSFNLLYMDRAHAFVTYYDDEITTHPLEPSIHVLTNGNINDKELYRIKRTFELLVGSEGMNVTMLLERFQTTLKDHKRGKELKDALCLHLGNYGTVSSSIIAMSGDPSQSIYLYVEGTPCHNTYNNISHLFSRL